MFREGPDRFIALLNKLNRLPSLQNANQRAFAHARKGVEPDTAWHQVMRSNERGWQGEEGESARKNDLCICTLHVPTREKGGCVERRGVIERASGCSGLRGEKNSGPEAGFDHESPKSETEGTMEP